MNCSKIEENRETPLVAKGFKTGGRTAGTLNKRTEEVLDSRGGLHPETINEAMRA